MIEKIIGITFIIIIAGACLLITGFVGIIIYKNYISPDNICLTEKAENYCKEINQTFAGNSVFWDGVWMFSCTQSERIADATEFEFLQSELNECLN